MIAETEQPFILTLRIDSEAQQYFDVLRLQHFPAERNFLKAHLTLFHKLPATEETRAIIASVRCSPFTLEIADLKNLGRGVAFKVYARQLEKLHAQLSQSFYTDLNAQDR
ncbi:MAG: 2'-5' RNA ligase family protein, partial [Sphingobacteriales bacterium]